MRPGPDSQRAQPLFETPPIDPGAEFNPLEYENLTRGVVTELMGRGPFGMPPDEQFDGAGVYAIFYFGRHPLYAPIRSPEADWPIYVGKAVLAGGRKGKIKGNKAGGRELYLRIRQHAKSIEEVGDLDLADFRCRFLVVTQLWVETAERFLIEHYQPAWNIAVDGFGIHDPGGRRVNQYRSEWDTLHPGRGFAEKLATHHERERIAEKVRSYLATRRPNQPLPPLDEETIDAVVEREEQERGD